MYKIKKDLNKNRIYISLSGIIPITEAKKIKEVLDKEAKELTPGFDLINDISNFIRGQEEAGLILQEVMSLMIEKKVNRIVRIVGNSKEGLIQFANNSLPAESYNLKYVPTLEEAEKFLNQSKI